MSRTIVLRNRLPSSHECTLHRLQSYYKAMNFTKVTAPLINERRGQVGGIPASYSKGAGL